MFDRSTNILFAMDTLRTLRELIAIDSPTGYTDKAADYIATELEALGWNVRRTVKGAVVAVNGDNPTLGLAAHTDTLGAIVSKVRPDGTLAFSTLGGPLLNTFEGCYVRIHTRKGKVFHGTMLLNNPSVHINSKSMSSERTPDTMHIRLDEVVHSQDDVSKLGIEVGNIIAVDPRYVELKSGYIKSHFLDNKAGCHVLLEVARRMPTKKITQPVELFFSTYEEVGHGGATGFSDSVRDLLVIDMGVVGDACDGTELTCSICAKDSGGPYDYEFRRTLTNLAEKNKIAYAVDVYPFYSSDGTAALRAGGDYRVALIGPGVAASHGMERAHRKGIEATIELCLAAIKHHSK
jgi:putative aminopeptidase FrvX